MKKLASVSLLAVALLLIAAAPSYAWRRGWHGGPGVRTHVFVGVGPAFWWGPPHSYYWYYPPPYYVYSPPAVIVEEPPIYVQQPAPPPAPQSYWYYCVSAKAYYPTVQTCPEAWVKVPPRPE